MNTFKNPEATGLILNLLARYADGKAESKFDKAVKESLGDDATVKQSVQQIVDAMRKKPEVMQLLHKEVAENPIKAFSDDKYKLAFSNMKTAPKKKLPDDDTAITVKSSNDNSNVSIRLFYRGLKCLEETSEISDSDEPYLITSVVDSNLNVQTVRNPFDQTSYTDVDAGEKRVGPEIAIYNGTAKDLTLIAVMMEHDHGNPEHFKGIIDGTVKAAAAAVKLGTGFTIPEAITDILGDIINALFGTEDDLIETDTRFISKSQLITWMNAPLKNKEKENLFGKEVDLPAPMGYHFRTWHVGDGGRYRAYYRVRKAE